MDLMLLFNGCLEIQQGLNTACTFK